VPIRATHKVGAGPKLAAYLPAVGTTMYVFTLNFVLIQKSECASHDSEAQQDYVIECQPLLQCPLGGRCVEAESMDD
jgi:hypothetical protein